MKNILKGKAMWAKVFEPDTKFNPDGVYSVNVLLPEAQAAPMCEYLDGLVQDAFDAEIKSNPKKKASLTTRTPYDRAVDQDGNETGDIEFKFKLKAKVQRRDGTSYEQKPIVVDAKRNKMEDTMVGNGSVVKVAFDPFPYVLASTKQVGLSLRIKGLQVLELVEYGGSGASMFDEEDGYVSEAVAKDDRQETPFDAEEEAYAEGDF
jgi:hypothetical protein